jgi:hypothetical protein
MNAHKLLLTFTFVAMVGAFGASSGLAHMKQTYDGSCVALSGFPGLLQKMHFFALGDCAQKPNNSQCAKEDAACTVQSGTGKVAGKCKNGPGGCQCLPN